MLHEKLNSLDHPRRAYLGSLTLLSSYDNVVQVKELHSKLRLAWLQYESCWAQVLSLNLVIDKND